MKPREQVAWFAERMGAKLQKNDYKGEWESFSYLMDRLEEESEKLITFTVKLRTEDFIGNKPSGALIARVIDEASDVANSAMMIADRARKMSR